MDTVADLKLIYAGHLNEIPEDAIWKTIYRQVGSPTGYWAGKIIDGQQVDYYTYPEVPRAREWLRYLEQPDAETLTDIQIAGALSAAAGNWIVPVPYDQRALYLEGVARLHPAAPSAESTIIEKKITAPPQTPAITENRSGLILGVVAVVIGLITLWMMLNGRTPVHVR